METPHSLLQKYWHHQSFRPLQEEIIRAVLHARDTLALLPTGGGKSICFQIPALMREGLCLVISPLIALMKDQVGQLNKRGIHALAIHSGMRRFEIDILLDNAIYGNVKFLYASPERLQTELFLARFRQMKIGLIAVDEAHCISQWGYDFRPSYLHIATLREIFPAVPVVALTASATEAVQADIVEKLKFREGHAHFRRSFARENLSFVVRKTENKDQQLLNILLKVSGPAILYVRSRKATVEIARWLSKKNIPASFYHAGLSYADRTRRQDDWVQNRKRVMVATNAFGMGIDKADVRLVIHMDLPENVESYYQEAGRAGRDGARAYAVMLCQDADITNLTVKTQQSQPAYAFLQEIYQDLANFFQLALGSGEGESFDFDMRAFCEQFDRHPVEVYNALKKLEEEGLLQFNESFYHPSALYVAVDHKKLYELQVANVKFDELIKMLLRLYGGEMFSSFVRIDESYLAKALKMTDAEVVAQLKHLHALNVLAYAPARDKPQLTYVLARQDAARLPLDRKRLDARRALVFEKMAAMTGFVQSTHRCRMQLIQDYFNELTDEVCGICDVCIEKRKKENLKDFENMRDEVLTVMRSSSMTVEQLEQRIAPGDHELFVDVVRELVDEGTLQYDRAWKLQRKGEKTS